MRKLATIRIVDAVKPIDGADRIEVAVIGGWNVVIKKGECPAGSKVVFFEIDSALPINDPRYAFLLDRCKKSFVENGSIVKECLRLKTIKLKGVISQGLVLPLSEFPEVLDAEVDSDVSEILKVEHYDELCEKYNSKGNCISGNAHGNFPSYLVPKTDEERVQNLTKMLPIWKQKKLLWQATEKADGSSFTFVYAPTERPENPFFVCSRNLELKPEPETIYWKMAYKYELFSKLQNYCDRNGRQLAIQMEIVGPGVNGNKDHYSEHEIRVFRIYDISIQSFLTPIECVYICDSELMIPHCKILRDFWNIFEDLHTVEDFLEFVKGKTDNGYEREGVVFKAWDTEENQLVSLKCINNDYLLADKN